MFFWSAASAAFCEFSVYDDSRNTMDAIAFGFCGHFWLVHVMDNNVA